MVIQVPMGGSVTYTLAAVLEVPGVTVTDVARAVVGPGTSDPNGADDGATAALDVPPLPVPAFVPAALAMLAILLAALGLRRLR